jgi:putative glutamine amidotransferase
VLGNASHAPEPGVFSSHPVRVVEGSRTAAVLGRTDVDGVPTYHHQAIDRLGERLVATAWSPDGLLEALEDPDVTFCIAVQWHPEEGADPALFEGLVAAARTRAAARTHDAARRAGSPSSPVGSA